MRIIAAGRTDLEDYFRDSGVRSTKKLTQHPFIIFVLSDDAVEVRIVESAKALLEYSDDTQVMAQWQGQWRSDFFQFHVGDFRRFITKLPPEKFQIV